MVIERLSTLQLANVEATLRKAALSMGATVIHQDRVHAAVVFTIEHSGLYEKLLSIETRFAAFLPCRIVVFEFRGGIKLVTMSPTAFAEDLHHPEIASTVALLENVLAQILVELQNLVSTDQQVDMRDTVPERIDEHGSKVEDLAGTGEQGSLGG